jgi:hypothetical protein
MKAYKQRSGFAKIPHALIDTWGQILGPQVTMVYICIISHIGAKTQVGFPSYSTIAEKCGMHRVTAIEAVADLVFLEFIAKKSCWHKDGDQDSNNYYVLDMPNVKAVTARLLSNNVEVPKKRMWIIEKLKEFTSATMTKRDYEKLVEERNTGLYENGVVVTDYHRGSETLPPVVVTDYHGGSVGLPKIDISKKIDMKETYLHTAKSENESQATSLDSTEKGVASDKPIEAGNNSEVETLIWGNLLMGDAVSTEKMLVKSELMKLSDKNMAQHVLDEVVTKYAAGKIKTSLTTYTKGLVNKANKGEFAPTNNLSLKRAEKAQKAITAKSNTPAPNTPKNFVAASTLVAGMKRMVAASGQRSIRVTPEEKEEMDKALAELAARKPY